MTSRYLTFTARIVDLSSNWARIHVSGYNAWDNIQGLDEKIMRRCDDCHITMNAN